MAVSCPWRSWPNTSYYRGVLCSLEMSRSNVHWGFRTILTTYSPLFFNLHSPIELFPDFLQFLQGKHSFQLAKLNTKEMVKSQKRSKINRICIIRGTAQYLSSTKWDCWQLHRLGISCDTVSRHFSRIIADGFLSMLLASGFSIVQHVVHAAWHRDSVRQIYGILKITLVPALILPRITIQIALRRSPAHRIRCLLNIFFMVSHVLTIFAFASIYVSSWVNIKSCINDMSLTIAWSNVKLEQNISVKNDMIQLVHLHIDCYRYISVFNELVLIRSQKILYLE